MGITAISFILEPAITGKPGPILPRLTVLLIFGFFTMILVLKGSPGEEEEE
jgi:preprotein translocase subunit SecG